MVATLPDPRRYPSSDQALPADRNLHALAEQGLAARTGREADALDAILLAGLEARLGAGDGASLRALLDTAPTLAIQRKLWRLLANATSGVSDDPGVRLFAIPVVLVTATVGAGHVTLAGVLDDAQDLEALLREHGVPGGCSAFSLAGSLVAAEALDVIQLPALLARIRALPQGNPQDPARSREAALLDLPPGRVEIGTQAAQLRFLVGAGVMRPAQVDAEAGFDRLAAPLSRRLSRTLSVPGATVLALPRRPSSPLGAVARGRAAHREVAAQLFASEALRQLRASVGEPVAVVSAHRTADAPLGGELRLSLSSPFSPRDAHGFRCPLHAGELVTDAATMLVDLMRDCRVNDVRMLAGVHADRDPVTGGPLLFKPGTIPPAAEVLLQ